VNNGSLLHRIVVHSERVSTEKNKKERDTTSNNRKALHCFFHIFLLITRNKSAGLDITYANHKTDSQMLQQAQCFCSAFLFVCKTYKSTYHSLHNLKQLYDLIN